MLSGIRVRFGHVWVYNVHVRVRVPVFMYVFRSATFVLELPSLGIRLYTYGMRVYTTHAHMCMRAQTQIWIECWLDFILCKSFINAAPVQLYACLFFSSSYVYVCVRVPAYTFVCVQCHISICVRQVRFQFRTTDGSTLKNHSKTPLITHFALMHTTQSSGTRVRARHIQYISCHSDGILQQQQQQQP